MIVVHHGAFIADAGSVKAITAIEGPGRWGSLVHFNDGTSLEFPQVSVSDLGTALLQALCPSLGDRGPT